MSAPLVDTRPVIAGPEASPVTLDRIAAFPPPGWQVPRLARVSPDGALVTYLQSESQSERMALWALDPGTGSARVLLRAEDLVAAEGPLTREEELRRERQRQRIAGVTSYAWAAKKPVLLVPLGDKLFVREPSGSIRALTSGGAPPIDPKICSDGSKIAFARGRELWLVEVESGKERQLTRDAAEGITRAQSDFNMQEEFNEPSGLWWSPSCDRIAYLEVDERKVQQIPVLGYRGGADLQLHRYPRTGNANPVTRLGIVDLKGVTTWVEMPMSPNFDPSDQYIGRIAWSPDGSALFFQRLSRSQQHVAVVRTDVKSGKSQTLLHHFDPAWSSLTAMRPVDARRLVVLWPRDGHLHLSLVSAENGELERQLTSGPWDVSQLVGVDAGRVLFVANRDAVLDRVLYSVDLASGEIARLSPEAGVHEIDGNEPARGWVDIHSAADRLPQATVYDGKGKAIAAIEVPRDADLASLQLRDAQMVSIPATGDAPELHGALLEPRNKQPGVRYPTIVMVYGGPGVQTVNNEYNPRLLWQHLADRGFVVFQLDNRGSAGRGRDFEAAIYKRMGDFELTDQLRGVEYLKTLPFVDPARIGIYGHSYGGYMAAMAMLRAPGTFAVGVAGSPVTDWRYYDTGYTERYMAMPQNNAVGYDASAIHQQAANLRGKLFLIHALMDENVHFEHTAKLIDALVAADKDFDLLVFPGERHGYRSPDSRKYAYRRVIDYFATHL